MESTDKQSSGAPGHSNLPSDTPTGAPSRSPTGLVRTRSGRLIRSDAAPATFHTASPESSRPWARFTVIGVVLVALLGFLVFLMSDAPGGEKGRLDSILKDVGFVVRQQKGPGITR